MKKLLPPVLVIAGLLATLAGCGRFKMAEREPWRRDAELACLRSKQVKPSDYIKPAKPIDGDYSCGADYPLKVAALTTETTASIPGQTSQELLTGISPEATLVCPMVAALDQWLAASVQPAAMARFGQIVVEIKTMGSYSCRPMNNQRGARLSEHGFANAVDVAGFRLADGRVVSVVKHWKNGAPEEQAFLRDVHIGACQHFSTVLGPGADSFHYDHIHVDLARHGVRGDRRVCKPVVQADPYDPAFPNAGSRSLDMRAMAPAQAAPGMPMQLGQQGQPVQPGQPAYPGNTLAFTPRNPPAAPVYNQPYGQPGQGQPGQPVDEDFDPSQFDLPDEPTASIRK